MVLALLAMGLVAGTLASWLMARTLGRRISTRRGRRSGSVDPSGFAPDPGRDRRAEQRARQLLRSCVNEEEWAMYRDLGFIRVVGVNTPSGVRAGEGPAPYAYLVYPHKPIVAYVPASQRLLSEYCVEFPDVSDGEPARLPASDDVLAKWMALTSDEGRVLARANMHLVGRQLDPARVRRDLWRLAEWERRRSTDLSLEAGAA